MAALSVCGSNHSGVTRKVCRDQPFGLGKDGQLCIAFPWGTTERERELIGVLSVRRATIVRTRARIALRGAGLGHLSSLENELRRGTK